MTVSKSTVRQELETARHSIDQAMLQLGVVDEEWTAGQSKDVTATVSVVESRLNKLRICLEVLGP